MEEHVAELGEGQALFPCFQSGSDRVLADHLVDAKQLADVAEEFEQPGGTEPLDVVGQDGAVVRALPPHAALEVQKPRDLGGDTGPVGLELVGIQQIALLALATRVADHAGAAADQSDRTVPGLLETLEEAQLLEVADVEAVGGRVEADVEGQSVGIDAARQRLVIGELVDEAAPAQVVEQGWHSSSLPRRYRRPRSFDPNRVRLGRLRPA